MKISIVGNIGSGKSTVIKKLSNHVNCYQEPIHKWSFLPLFYKNQEKYAFHLQIQILLSFYDYVIDNCSGVFERSSWESFYIFTTSLFNENKLTNEEYDIIKQLYNIIGWKPEITIYLRCSPTTCLKRIQNRNRECESSISLDYLEKLYRIYENHLNIYDFVIDAEQHNDVVYQKVSDIVVNNLKINI